MLCSYGSRYVKNNPGTKNSFPSVTNQVRMHRKPFFVSAFVFLGINKRYDDRVWERTRDQGIGARSEEPEADNV